jgi:hypothetical protein
MKWIGFTSQTRYCLTCLAWKTLVFKAIEVLRRHRTYR